MAHTCAHACARCGRGSLAPSSHDGCARLGGDGLRLMGVSFSLKDHLEWCKMAVP